MKLYGVLNSFFMKNCIFTFLFFMLFSANSAEKSPDLLDSFNSPIKSSHIYPTEYPLDTGSHSGNNSSSYTDDHVEDPAPVSVFSAGIPTSASVDFIFPTIAQQHLNIDQMGVSACLYGMHALIVFEHFNTTGGIVREGFDLMTREATAQISGLTWRGRPHVMKRMIHGTRDIDDDLTHLNWEDLYHYENEEHTNIRNFIEKYEVIKSWVIPRNIGALAVKKASHDHSCLRPHKSLEEQAGARVTQYGLLNPLDEKDVYNCIKYAAYVLSDVQIYDEKCQDLVFKYPSPENFKHTILQSVFFSQQRPIYSNFLSGGTDSSLALVHGSNDISHVSSIMTAYSSQEASQK